MLKKKLRVIFLLYARWIGFDPKTDNRPFAYKPLDLQTLREKIENRKNDLWLVGYLENNDVSNVFPQMDYNIQKL